jgi:hypothetical protein
LTSNIRLMDVCWVEADHEAGCPDWAFCTPSARLGLQQARFTTACDWRSMSACIRLTASASRRLALVGYLGWDDARPASTEAVAGRYRSANGATWAANRRWSRGAVGIQIRYRSHGQPYAAAACRADVVVSVSCRRSAALLGRLRRSAACRELAARQDIEVDMQPPAGACATMCATAMRA